MMEAIPKARPNQRIKSKVKNQTPGSKYSPWCDLEEVAFRKVFCGVCEHYWGGCDVLSRWNAISFDDTNQVPEWMFGADGHPLCTAFLHESPERRVEACALTRDMFDGSHKTHTAPKCVISDPNTGRRVAK